MYVYMYIHNMYHSPPLLQGGQLSVPNFELGEIRKKWVPGGNSCHAEYLPGALAMFLVKKRLKKKYGFEFSISNVDLGLF